MGLNAGAARTDILETTTDLMRYRTTADKPDELSAAIDYVEDYFSGSGCTVRRHEVDGTPSLLVSSGAVYTPEVLLHGHIDVVEGDDDLFTPRVDDGYLYGRGAADMKSGVAALMYVLAHTEAETGTTLAVTADEEIGGYDGMQHLVQEEGLRPDVGISAEPSTRDEYSMEIIAKQKGLLTVTLRASGTSIHTSKPWKGESAAETLVDAYNQVRRRFAEPSPDSRTWAPTISLSSIESTTEAGLPEEGQMQLDIWTNEDYRNEEVLADIRDIDGIEVETEFDEPMLDTPADNAYVQELQSAADSIDGDVPVTRKAAASDMRFLSEEGIPAVVFGPEGHNAHSAREYAVISSFDDYAAIIDRFLHRLS